MNVFVAILLLCQKLAPLAWYYRRDADMLGLKPEQLPPILDFLKAEKLIEKVAGDEETGPGITLTEFGRKIAADPDALARLTRGDALDPDDPGAQVRADLRKPSRSIVTYCLLAANFAVFFYGLWLAWGVGIFRIYLTGFMTSGLDVLRYQKILHTEGSVSGEDLLAGNWWRLMSSAFVHGGALHILMNMYALWALGAFAERIWGHWRYLLIYLVAAFVGGCVAMTYNPGIPTVGASGAICGILGATGVFTFLAGRHLPEDLAGSLRTNLIINTIIIGVLSMMPGVSGWGHLGGAIGGAAAALVMHFQRFGGPSLRTLAPLGLIPICWGAYAYLQSVRVDSVKWAVVEESHLTETRTLSRIDEAIRKTKLAFQERAEDLFGVSVRRRKPEDITAAIEDLNSGITAAVEMISELKRPSPYLNKGVRDVLAAALKQLEYREAFLESCIRSLKAGPAWTVEEEKASSKIWDDVLKSEKEWKAAKQAIRDAQEERRKKPG